MNTPTTIHHSAPSALATENRSSSATSGTAWTGDGVTRLTHWGVIRAQGADTVKFLHGQLTQDFSLLGLSEARLAALCSAKGRMLASFVGWKLASDDVLLACPRDLLAPTLKRLSMFVLRAQCKLSDASELFDLHGVSGTTALALAEAAGLGPATWAKASLPDADMASTALIRLPGAGAAPHSTPRLLACLPAGQALPMTAPVLTLEQWSWLEVQSGVAAVSQAVVEAFVPQMLNYESVGGVNFKKGCYPGQEVVARSQYRGTLKRRAYRVACEQPLGVGQDIFHSSDAEQACGTVVVAAPRPSGLAGADHPAAHEALVSMQTSAAQGGTLTLGSATGPALALLPLPYELLADI